MKRVILNIILSVIVLQIKAEEIRIMINAFNILEYKDSYSESTLLKLKVNHKNIYIEFELFNNRKIASQDTAEAISFETFISKFDKYHQKPNYKYVLIIKEKTGYFEYYSNYFDVFRKESEKLYIYQNNQWFLEADFLLKATPNLNCGDLQKSIMPDKKILILEKIKKVDNAKIYCFKKCLVTSTYLYLSEYIKGLGRIQYAYPSERIEYKLWKIDSILLEDFIKSSNLLIDN